MDENQFEGAARSFGGKVQEKVGDLTGDSKTQFEGAARDAAGRAQRAYGDAASQVRSAASDLSHSIEQQPLAALLIVGAIGFVLGLAAGRR